jgi:hypothetical protein
MSCCGNVDLAPSDEKESLFLGATARGGADASCGSGRKGVGRKKRWDVAFCV